MKHPPIHSMKRRAQWHNYAGRAIYLLTLTTLNRRRVLGTLITEPRPNVTLSRLGYDILHEEIPKISHFYPNVEVWKVMIMPDHIHMIVYVKEPFGKRKDLAWPIRGFKSGCNKAFRRHSGNPEAILFEENYNDKILKSRDTYPGWAHYLDDNPRRLAMKIANPELFTIVNNRPVVGKSCQMVGNLFLLDIPDKMAIVVHRSDDDATYAEKSRQWLQCGQRGGVLVSAAISPREKLVLREAMNRGYNIIWLRNNGFPRLYKPPGEAFDACAEGHLLMLSPFDYDPRKHEITRAECLAMNTLAELLEAEGAGGINGAPKPQL